MLQSVFYQQMKRNQKSNRNSLINTEQTQTHTHHKVEGKIKIYPNISLCLNNESVSFFIPFEAKSQISMIANLCCVKEEKSQFLPRLLQRQTENEFYLLCRSCNEVCSSIQNYQSQDCLKEEFFGSVIILYTKIIEAYKALTQVFMNSKFSFRNNTLSFKFSDVLFRASCPENHSSFFLIDFGIPKTNSTNNFLSLLKHLKSLVYSSLSQQKKNMIDLIIEELKPPSPYQFYESLLRALSVLKSLELQKQQSLNESLNCKNRIKKPYYFKDINQENRNKGFYFGKSRKYLNERKFTIQNFYKTSKRNDCCLKLNQTTNRVQQNRSFSKRKRTSLELFRRKEGKSNFQKSSLKLQNSERERKLISQLTELKNSITNRSNNANESSQVLKERIEWSEMERISEQMSFVEKKQNKKYLEEAKQTLKDETKESEELVVEDEQLREKIDTVMDKMDKKITEEINPIGQSITIIKDLLHIFKEKNILPLYLLYKKFFYLRVSFLATLSNADEPILSAFTSQQWKLVQQSKTYLERISRFGEENHKILKVLEDLKGKVEQKMKKKSIKLQKKVLLRIDDDDESYGMFIHQMIKMNYQKYVAIEKECTKSSPIKIIQSVYHYGKIILLSVLDDLEDYSSYTQIRNEILSTGKMEYQSIQGQKMLLDKIMGIFHLK